MNYDYVGILSLDRSSLRFFPSQNADPPHSSFPGGSLCGKHVAQIRKTRLHLHRGFVWHDKQ